MVKSTYLLIAFCLIAGGATLAAAQCNSENDCTGQICSAGLCVDCSSLVSGCSQCSDGTADITALCVACGDGYENTPIDGSCLAVETLYNVTIIPQDDNLTSTDNNITIPIVTSTENITVLEPNAYQQGTWLSTPSVNGTCPLGFLIWNTTNDTTTCHACWEEPYAIEGCANCTLTENGSIACYQCQLGYVFIPSTSDPTLGSCLDISFIDPICLVSVLVNATYDNSTDGINRTQQIFFDGTTETGIANTTGWWQCLECPWPISFLGADGHCIAIYAFDTYASSVWYVNGSYNLTCVPGYYVWQDPSNSSNQYCQACEQFDPWAATCIFINGTVNVTSCWSGFYVDNVTGHCLDCNIDNAATCWIQNDTIVATSCLGSWYLYNGSCYASGIPNATLVVWQNQSWYNEEEAYWFNGTVPNTGATGNTQNSTQSGGEANNTLIQNITQDVIDSISSLLGSADVISASDPSTPTVQSVVYNVSSNVTYWQSWQQVQGVDGGWLEVLDCAWGYFLVNNTCVACSDYYGNFSTCSWTWPQGWFQGWNAGNNSVVEPPGSWPKLLACADGYYWSVSNQSCQSCGIDSYVRACIPNADETQFTPTQCFDGFYLNNGTCVACDTNCSICYGNVQQTWSICLKCVPGFYLGSDNYCYSCPLFNGTNGTDHQFGIPNETLSQYGDWEWLNVTGTYADSNYTYSVWNSTEEFWHPNYYNDQQLFDQSYYQQYGQIITDGEQWQTVPIDQFFLTYTLNGTVNYGDSVNYNYVINAFTNWAVINVTESTLWKITQVRNASQCIVAALQPVCFGCNQSLQTPQNLTIGNGIFIDPTFPGLTSSNSSQAANTTITVQPANITINSTQNQTVLPTANITTNFSNSSNVTTSSQCSQSIANCQSCDLNQNPPICLLCLDSYYLSSAYSCEQCTNVLPNCAICLVDNQLNVNCNQCFFGYTLSGNVCNHNTASSSSSSTLAFSFVILALLQAIVTLA